MISPETRALAVTGADGLKAIRTRAHPRCVVCSPANPMGLGQEFALQPDGSVESIFMTPRTISKLDHALANVCRNCPVCRRARHQQSGVAFRLVNQLERQFCPFCRAYERVYGRKAHEKTA